MEGTWKQRLLWYRGSVAVAAGLGVAAALVFAAGGVGQAQDASPGGSNGQAIDTGADYTPFEDFAPLSTSTPCVGEEGGRGAQPFVTPAGYGQQVVAEETDAVRPGGGGSEDLWDMNTQNEFGEDAGRYVYRTHEVGAAPTSDADPAEPGGSQVTVTDLKTGETRILAERNDWERFDGIVWTPWGTILAAEETFAASASDPQVEQAKAGLVYELFVDPDEPWKLDPSREQITPNDGTTDTVRDGIRARPSLGSKSHEGMRFDERGFHYGIAETRGGTTEGQSGAIFRFVPDREGDLSTGQLQALRTEDRRYGEGTWVDLDRQAVQVDADAEAESKGANEYQRPEDVETGESTGVDRNNGGNTVYVAVTEGVPTTANFGIIAIDVTDPSQPFAYPYAGPDAGNTPPDFTNPDNLALDRDGNLAISEDPPENPVGADVFIAKRPRSQEDHKPANTVQRFASLKDCVAEPTGIYFALEGTARFVEGTELEGLVTDETLFVNRQHAGQTSTVDQLVAIDLDEVEGCTITGTDGDDVLIGTNGPDVICGRRGNDVIRGLGGNDRLYGESGNDRVFGGAGGDLVNGGINKDLLDSRDGVEGNDRLDGITDGVKDTFVRDRGDRIIG